MGKPFTPKGSTRKVIEVACSCFRSFEEPPLQPAVNDKLFFRVTHAVVGKAFYDGTHLIPCLRGIDESLGTYISRSAESLLLISDTRDLIRSISSGGDMTLAKV